MLELSPQRNQTLWMLYAADTLPEWQDTATETDTDDSGGAGPSAAGTWMAATGALTADETRALVALHTRLRGAGRPDLFRAARTEAPAPDVEAAQMYAALETRVSRVYELAAATLDGWAAELRRGQAPAWYKPATAALAGFMGGTLDGSLVVHLLPAAPDLNGRTWATFIGVGHRALLCGGPPARPDQLYEELIHLAAHGAQPAALDLLVAAFLATAEGRQLERQFEATPYAPRRRRLLDLADPGIDGYVREMVVHTLVYQGALRETGGLPSLDEYWRQVIEASGRILDDPDAGRTGDLYTAWILGGCAHLQPLARQYLAEGRRIDAPFVRAAFAAFELLHARWEQTLQREGGADPTAAVHPAGAPAARAGAWR
jgi:hypothetical protein